MAKNKTTENEASVTDFINSVPDPIKRENCIQLNRLMTEATNLEPRMWGSAIVGFGSYHYKYESGHEGDAPLVGFSPRSQAISVYLSIDPEKREELLARLGKYKTAKACLYIKKLADVDLDILKKLLSSSFQYASKTLKYNP